MPQHEWRHHLLSGRAYRMDCCLSGAYISQFVRSWNSCNKWGLKIVDGDPSSRRRRSEEWIWYRWHAEASPLYNDNESCVKWSHNVTKKQIRHMEMRKNAVREWVQDAFLKVLHVSGRINPADIFTKEMRDGAHFWCLRDSFMCPLSDFLKQSLLNVHLLRQHDECQPLQLTPLAASSSASFTRGSYLMALFLLPLSSILSAISHLSSAGRQIFRSLHRVVPLVLIWH